MPIPALVAVGIQALPEIIRLGQELWDSYQNGTLTQEEYNEKWAAMQSKVIAAEAKWDAAGQ